MTIADCPEQELVARVRRHLAPPPSWLLVGIGDDGAVVEPERNRAEVLTVDAIVEGVHFDRAFVPPEAIGHRALAVNLSDLAAMGASPRLALLSMVLPPSLPLDDFDRIAQGFAALATVHAIHVVGGNLTRSTGPLVIDVTVMGTVKRRQALTRAGALPGDELYLSGPIGSAAAGLMLLREETQQSSVVSRQSSVNSLQSTVGNQQPGDGELAAFDGPLKTDDSRLTTDDSRLTTDDWRLKTAYLLPHPRVRLGVLLSRNRAASACVDLSDGLGDAVRRIAESSGVGATIDADALPIDDHTRVCFESRGLDVIERAITSGDDYELLIAVRPRVVRRLAGVARQAGMVLTRIGRCHREPDVLLQRSSGGSAIDCVPLPPGYSHFR